MSCDVETDFGFRWGPMDVLRSAQIHRRGGWYRVVSVETEHRKLDIYVSPTGRSVRVFSEGEEWVPPSGSGRADKEER